MGGIIIGEGNIATVLAASGKAQLEGVTNRPITWINWSDHGAAHPLEALGAFRQLVLHQSHHAFQMPSMGK